MPIASFLVSCSDENIEQIAIYLKSKPQYEVLGIENNNIAVLSDTQTLDEEYELAQNLSNQTGVKAINVLIHNTEDQRAPVSSQSQLKTVNRRKS